MNGMNDTRHFPQSAPRWHGNAARFNVYFVNVDSSGSGFVEQTPIERRLVERID